MNVNDLETPSVLIDINKMQANIDRMQTRCDSLGLNFRAHVKTHKIPDIARMQIDAGAVGIASQKVSEARVFTDAGITDILIPYSIIGAKKAQRLADLTLAARVTVSTDSDTCIAGLSEVAAANHIILRMMIELETDLQRTGAPIQRVLKLAQCIDQDDNLEFAGLLVYPSNLSVRTDLQEALRVLDSAGISVDSVSGGGTGAAMHAHEVPELTELRVGTYIFNDWGSVKRDWAILDDCAMRVAATVISCPTDRRAILDTGSKSLGSETVDDCYGYVVEYPDARLHKLNEEHGYLDVSACEHPPAIGERVHIIPAHTCVVSNLHNQLYGVRGEEVEVVWPVAARGMVW